MQLAAPVKAARVAIGRQGVQHKWVRHIDAARDLNAGTSGDVYGGDVRSRAECGGVGNLYHALVDQKAARQHLSGGSGGCDGARPRACVGSGEFQRARVVLHDLGGAGETGNSVCEGQRVSGADFDGVRGLIHRKGAARAEGAGGAEADVCSARHIQADGIVAVAERGVGRNRKHAALDVNELANATEGVAAIGESQGARANLHDAACAADRPAQGETLNEIRCGGRGYAVGLVGTERNRAGDIQAVLVVIGDRELSATCGDAANLDGLV